MIYVPTATHSVLALGSYTRRSQRATASCCVKCHLKSSNIALFDSNSSCEHVNGLLATSTLRVALKRTRGTPKLWNFHCFFSSALDRRLLGACLGLARAPTRLSFRIQAVVGHCQETPPVTWRARLCHTHAGGQQCPRSMASSTCCAMFPLEELVKKWARSW